jgi:hypothetical protein
MVSQRPYFPGSLGALLSRQFHYFSRFMQNTPSLHPRRFIQDVDALICRLAGEADAPERGSGNTEKRNDGKRRSGRPASGFAAAAVPAAAFWIFTIALSYVLQQFPF